jgi:hypothetical protein
MDLSPSLLAASVPSAIGAAYTSVLVRVFRSAGNARDCGRRGVVAQITAAILAVPSHLQGQRCPVALKSPMRSAALADQPLQRHFVLATLVGDEQCAFADHDAPADRTRQIKRHGFKRLLPDRNNVDLL